LYLTQDSAGIERVQELVRWERCRKGEGPVSTTAVRKAGWEGEAEGADWEK
jgi:hypothetical protein